jgi:hypothetical protein
MVAFISSDLERGCIHFETYGHFENFRVRIFIFICRIVNNNYINYINCTSLTMTVVCLQKTRDTYLLISDIDLGMYVLSGAIFLFSFLGEGGLI